MSGKLFPALLKVQADIGAIKKDEKNPFFNSSYVSLNAVRDSVVTLLTKNNLVLIQPTKVVEGKQYVATTIVHAESGESVEALTEVVAKNALDAQQVGSGISYARRYGLMSLLCLAAEDDDGNSAAGKTSEKAETKATATTTTAPAAAKAKVSFSKKATTPAPVSTSEEL
jgi:hypothetical protein